MRVKRWGSGGGGFHILVKEVIVVAFYLVPLRVFECRQIPVPLSVFSHKKTMTINFCQASGFIYL